MHDNPFNPMNSPKTNVSYIFDEVDCCNYVYEEGFEDNSEICKKGWDIDFCSFCKHNKAKSVK